MYCTMNGGSCEWSSEDFASRYISRSSRNSSPERERNYESNISFTSSPDHHTYDLLCAEKKFCNRDNIDQSISYLNQVRQVTNSHITQEIKLQSVVLYSIRSFSKKFGCWNSSLPIKIASGFRSLLLMDLVLTCNMEKQFILNTRGVVLTQKYRRV